MKLMFLVLLLSLVLLPSCSVSHGNFTVMSNKLFDTDNLNVSNKTRQKNVVGKDVSHIIFFVPTKSNPNLNDALNDAFRRTDTDVMTDVEVTAWGWWIPYLYGQFGWTIEGDAVKTRGVK